MGQVGTSGDILGCEGTFETWDFGHCSRWDKSGHPGISRDVKGHLRPGTLGIVLGGTSRDILGSSVDILGCEGTFETWDLATVLGRTSRDIPGYPGMSRDVKGHLRPGTWPLF